MIKVINIIMFNKLKITNKVKFKIQEFGITFYMKSAVYYSSLNKNYSYMYAMMEVPC